MNAFDPDLMKVRVAPGFCTGNRIGKTQPALAGMSDSVSTTRPME
jgi:hypothetical protein